MNFAPNRACRSTSYLYCFDTDIHRGHARRRTGGPHIQRIYVQRIHVQRIRFQHFHSARPGHLVNPTRQPSRSRSHRSAIPAQHGRRTRCSQPFQTRTQHNGRVNPREHGLEPRSCYLHNQARENQALPPCYMRNGAPVGDILFTIHVARQFFFVCQLAYPAVCLHTEVPLPDCIQQAAKDGQLFHHDRYEGMGECNIKAEL